MTINDLQKEVKKFIEKYRENGFYPKENKNFDYKKELNSYGLDEDKALDIFIRNFWKDILSFSNSDGGIIILGMKENLSTGQLDDIGLPQDNLKILSSLDPNDIIQKLKAISQVGINIEIQNFQISSRKFYYILIEKSFDVLFPIKEFKEYDIKKGVIYFRLSGKNEIVNESSTEFNRFLQIKANEKNREFMEIWTKLLPEMFDINPREILMINPKTNKIYGFNKKDGVLSSANIDIDKENEENGIFNIILNAISAGDIGKISDTEGKPLYKLVGTITKKDSIPLTTFHEHVDKQSAYKISQTQLKMVMKYLGWVNRDNFKIENPPNDLLNKEFHNYIWIDTTNTLKHKSKIVFSEDGIKEVLKVIEDVSLHDSIFMKNLELKENDKAK